MVTLSSSCGCNWLLKQHKTSETRTSQTLNHQPPAAVAELGLFGRGRTSSCHSQICRCMRMQPVLNSSELWTTFCSQKNFMTISQMIQELLHRQTNRQTQIHTNRSYWKQYHLHYAITARVVIKKTTSMTFQITLHYIKSYLECPKSLRTARTLYEIKGVMWEYSYVGKHLEKRQVFKQLQKTGRVCADLMSGGRLCLVIKY